MPNRLESLVLMYVNKGESHRSIYIYIYIGKGQRVRLTTHIRALSNKENVGAFSNRRLSALCCGGL